MDIHDIDKITFGILSATNIRKFAVCKIDSTKLMGPGSVYDEKMGCSIDSNDKCVTCGMKKECPGHFGYLELNEPVLHPLFYKQITNFLKCFCKNCHRLVLSKEQLSLDNLDKIKGERRFVKILEKLKKNDVCSNCESPQPKIVFKPKDMTIGMEHKQKGTKNKVATKIDIILTVEEIKKIFDDVSNEDIRSLGFHPDRIHPKDLIITVLPVIPPCSRPYVIADGNMCDDDITYQLIEIIKINNQLGTIENTDEKKKQKLIQALKFRLLTLYNNSKGTAKHPTDSRPLKGFKERLSGKEGRLRSNLMGDKNEQIPAEICMKL